MWGELSSEWGELSSECGLSCLGASFIWGEMSWGELSLGRVVRNPVNLYSNARYCFIIVLKQNWIHGRFSPLEKENSIRKIIIFAKLE